MPNNNGASRLDRIEAVIDKHTQQIALLLEHGRRVNDALSKIGESHHALSEGQLQVNAFLKRIAEDQLRPTEAQNRLELAQAETTEEINDFLSKIAAAQLKLAESQNRLELAQAETTEKLNALISVVDDLVRRRGGEQPL